MTTPTRAPLDEAAFTRAREDAMGSSAGRLLLTTLVVTFAAIASVTVAYHEMRASEALYGLPIGTTVAPVAARAASAVSDYTLRALVADGSLAEAHFWRGTARDYLVHARAGEREQPIVAASFVSARVFDSPMPLARWGYVDADGTAVTAVTDSEAPLVQIEGYGRFAWSTFEEPCPGGTMRSWRLCQTSAGGADGARGADARCLVAPEASACWHGPLHIVAFHEAGDTLWAVVERTMPSRTARMVAGLTRRP